MINPGIAGQTALVTGANHGIGAAIARALAAQGAAVLISYLRVPTPTEATPYTSARALSAQDLVAAIQAAGGRAAAVEADLSDPASIPALFDQAERHFGPTSILVQNAAAWTPDTLIPGGLTNEAPDTWPPSATTITAASHDLHFAVNSRATALLMAEFTRRHVARGARSGRIITISTDGAEGFASEMSYGASKAALESYSRGAAGELGRYGITVNIVSPGPIDTGWVTPEFAADIARGTPLGRVGAPEDIADVVVFLASEQARWVSGQRIRVNGGSK
jgi:3-oxoacyl-[acyl-carrier protein] reductase